eukprot:5162290-Amphidinium_carterae.2
MGQFDDYTWAHTSGSLHQIDYIFLDQRLMEAVTKFELGEWGEFDLTTTIDHRSLVGALAVGKIVKFKGRQKRVRFQDDSHRAAFIDAVQHGVLGSLDSNMPPESFIHLLVTILCHVPLTLLLPRGRQCSKPSPSPCQPWILQQTWEYIRLNHYRRLRVELLSLSWRLCCCHESCHGHDCRRS